ncbi:hypothetical protein Bca4012_050204 [Brassica carinata]
MATKVASSPSLPKSGAISKGYNFASTWDQSAPLTEEQQSAIVSLSQAVAERPFPANLYVYRPENGLSVSAEDTNLGDSEVIEAVLVNTNQKDLFDKECDTVGFASAFVFYKWFTDLESAMKSETEEKYLHYVNTLTERIQTNYPTQVDETLDLFNELQLQHQTVTTKTKTLHDACDRLLMEKQKLMEFAEALRSKLNYFDELENISSNFYSPNMSVSNSNFVPLLKRLDECISYIESNPQYAESSVYLLKFRQLQSRALGMIRTYILAVLKTAASQVQAAFRGTDGNKASVSEGVEASVIYVRFKAAASELKPVLEEIESRSARKEYVQILAECHRLYCDQRLSLVKGIVHQRVSEVSKKEALPSLTRSGLSYGVSTVYSFLSSIIGRSFESGTFSGSFIANYIPSYEDLDYPGKLERSANTPSDTNLGDAVEVCSLSVQKASKLVIKRSTTMDGQLFLIKHLLILREQIVPFDIEFSVTHKELDFSHLLEHLRRILRGQASLFDWSRSTFLARTLSPRVLESQIDAKKELEKCLKTTCEEFIMSVTKLVVDPMLSFVTKVTAIKVALSTGTQNQKVDSVMAKPL